VSIVTVPLVDFLRVLPFKADYDRRFYLNGVLVTPYEDHALLIATNGHWLAAYESAEARTDQDRILDIPEWFARQIRDLVARGDNDHDEEDRDDDVPWSVPSLSGYILTVEDERSRLVISQAGVEQLVKPEAAFLEGKYPDWRKVIPDPTALDKGLFTPVAAHYLAALHEAVPDEREHALFCYQEREKSSAPVVFRFGKMPELVIVLMPRRDDGGPGAWPKWMSKTP